MKKKNTTQPSKQKLQPQTLSLLPLSIPLPYFKPSHSASLSTGLSGFRLTLYPSFVTMCYCTPPPTLPTPPPPSQCLPDAHLLNECPQLSLEIFSTNSSNCCGVLGPTSLALVYIGISWIYWVTWVWLWNVHSILSSRAPEGRRGLCYGVTMWSS